MSMRDDDHRDMSLHSFICIVIPTASTPSVPTLNFHTDTSHTVSNPSGGSSAEPDSPQRVQSKQARLPFGNDPNAANAPPGTRAATPPCSGGGEQRRDVGDLFRGGDRGGRGGGLGRKKRGDDEVPSEMGSAASVNGGRDVKKDGD